ncbi:MAG: YdcF family protein [Acidobacteria bacterium]|nr:MAG: YdcF family protein [Acidobacteriota bacterium]
MRLRHLVFLILIASLAGATVLEVSLYKTIRRQAASDEAKPVAAIVVFGAAEYNGRPSPVYKARLDHAFYLEEHGFAPLVITTGGSGGDPHFTEGGVGRDYLIQQGVAARKIVEETRSETTFQTVSAVAQILKSRGESNCLVVSDGFHLYRIKQLFSSFGITAYTSPAPASPIEAEPFARTLYSLRELLIISLWHVGFHV